jgi:Na+/H+ antiporter NhaD/arsenite permease-like protein
VVAVMVRGKLPLFPYLMALATSANIGSAATLVGNPQNMIIGVRSGIPFGQFSWKMAPVAAVCLAINYGMLWLSFRKELAAAKIETPSPGEKPALHLDRPLLWKGVAVMVLLLCAFFAGWDIGWSALAAAALLMVLARRDTHEVLKLVDFHLLVFFAGLFVVVGALNDNGFPDMLHQWIEPWLGAGRAAQAWNFTWLSVIGSNVFSNVPFVLVASPWVAASSDPALLWKVLSLATTFAGNLTILGSVANVIVLESARGKIELGFWDYAKIGVPITIVTTVCGVGMLVWLG